MSPANPLEPRIRARLAALEADGLLRALHPPAGIDLSSNDYLNLARHPRIGARVIEAIAREGMGSTGSRLLRGDREVFQAVERRFAAFKGAERSLYFGAGYLANLAILSTLPERGDVIFSDAFNHASLIDGMRLSKARTVVFPHNDVAALTRLIAENESAVRFIVVESLFSMQGDIAPLAEYEALCRATGAVLIVDEAHAVGIYGARGTGLLEAAGVGHSQCISINTGGKALGVAGACVAGPSWAIEYLLQRGRPFVFTTAPPPAFAEALDASLDVVASEPERRRRVLELSAHVRARLRERGIPVIDGISQIVPVVIGDNDRSVAVAATLQRDGFDVRAIRPPSVPAGTARLRVSINGGLSEVILDQLCRSPRIGSQGGPPLRRGVFVTGTDTGVGKTIASAAFMHYFRGVRHPSDPVDSARSTVEKSSDLGDSGRGSDTRLTPRYWKPIQTGIEQDDDTAEVRRLGACPAEEILDRGVRLERPLSPHLSARFADRPISLDAVMGAIDGEAQEAAWVIEGAGGALVPLNDSELMIDVMVRVGLPVAVVSRTGLGTINHTLLTLEALRARSLTIAGVLLVGDRNDDNRDAIATYGGVRILGEMPRFDPLTPDALGAWARAHLDPGGVL